MSSPEWKENKAHRILSLGGRQSSGLQFHAVDMSLALWRFVSLINDNSAVFLGYT